MSDPSKELQAGEATPFSVMWFVTHTGAKYEIPDMRPEEITRTHKSLDHIGEEGSIVAVNLSGAVLALPKRIIRLAGVGERIIWEAT